MGILTISLLYFSKCKEITQSVWTALLVRKLAPEYVLIFRFEFAFWRMRSQTIPASIVIMDANDHIKCFTHFTCEFSLPSDLSDESHSLRGDIVPDVATEALHGERYLVLSTLIACASSTHTL